MDYMNSAFGVFSPHLDEDASVKFILNIVLMDDRLKELADILRDGSEFGGMEGEPGWLIERRDVIDESNEAAYPGWPDGARFKTSVDPNYYQLQYPEFFMSREKFVEYVNRAIDAYVSANSRRSRALSVIALRNAAA